MTVAHPVGAPPVNDSRVRPVGQTRRGLIGHRAWTRLTFRNTERGGRGRSRAQWTPTVFNHSSEYDGQVQSQVPGRPPRAVWLA